MSLFLIIGSKQQDCVAIRKIFVNTFYYTASNGNFELS